MKRRLPEGLPQKEGFLKVFYKNKNFTRHPMQKKTSTRSSIYIRAPGATEGVLCTEKKEIVLYK